MKTDSFRNRNLSVKVRVRPECPQFGRESAVRLNDGHMDRTGSITPTADTGGNNDILKVDKC